LVKFKVYSFFGEVLADLFLIFIVLN